MILPEYIIDNKEGALRWENRKDFLENEDKIKYTKKNKVAIVCLFYKSTENLRILANYISREEENKEFDFIIINNSQGIEFDFAKELKINNIIVLSTIANLGTDGGYCIGLEYTIYNEYDYVFLVEDDVVFLDDQAFSSVYKEMNKKTLGFLSSVINYPQPHSHSCSYQFACYPIDFLKEGGTIDPRFFTRGGEGEREPRIEKMIKKYGYKKVVINKRHFHPYLKKNNRSSRWMYFSRRNALWNTKMTKKISAMNVLILFMYIRSGYTKLFMGKSGKDLVALYLAVKDFLFSKKILSLSLYRIAQLYTSWNKGSEIEKELTTRIDKIDDYTSGLFVMGKPASSGVGISGFTNQDLARLKRSSKISAFFKKGIVIPNINSPVYPVALLSKKIVAINELDVCNNTADISIFQNKQNFKIVKVVIALLLGIITFSLAMPFIFIKMVLYRFLKK